MLFGGALSVVVFATASVPTMYVDTNTASRACANLQCDVLDTYNRTDAVKVLEIADGWVRVTGKGDALGRLTPEWINLADLAFEKPMVPATGATDLAIVMAESDDYLRFGERFETAARLLIENDLCSEEQLLASSGWDAPAISGAEPIYSLVCGKRRVAMNMRDLSIVPPTI
jgi:hypothetical protein